MQFALLRTLYDQYTWYDDDGVTAHPPTFLMDAQALGGVVIKKLLVLLHPKSFDQEKDLALIETKNAMSKGRNYVVSEVDGTTIELNDNYGCIRSYYIEELNEQLGFYRIPDDKIDTDFVMTLVMGVSYILKKVPKVGAKPAELNLLNSYNNQIRQFTNRRPLSSQNNNFFRR